MQRRLFWRFEAWKRLAEIQTSARTVVSFLVKPLHDQISRAFREK